LQLVDGGTHITENCALQLVDGGTHITV